MAPVGGTEKGPTCRQRALGDRVREHRQQRTLTQEDVAHLAGLHRTYLTHVETGRVNPSLETLARLALALDCDLADLTQGLQDIPGRT